MFNWVLCMLCARVLLSSYEYLKGVFACVCILVGLCLMSVCEDI